MQKSLSKKSKKFYNLFNMEENIAEKKEEKLIEERKKKLAGFLKKSNIWIIGFLIIALILGIYIRSLPMSNHSGNGIPSIWSFIFHGEEFFGGRPGLWDITTNTWTLGPDLDPWFFTRYAKTIVEQGSLPKIDMMRNFPLGFDTSKETKLLPYIIAGAYYVAHFFNSSINVEFGGAILPVIMFALAIISFFLFVREIFTGKNEKDRKYAGIIALISTFFMIVIPVFLSRTIAGIPEKESAGFFFMFLSFYLFLKTWKSESLKKSVFFGLLAGVSTAAMGLIWGGVVYVFITIGVSCFFAFILGMTEKKNFVSYSLWLFSSFLILSLFTKKFPIKSLITSMGTGFSFAVFLIFLVNFVLWETSLSKIKILNKIRQKRLTSLLLSVVLIVLSASIFFGPGFIIDKLKELNQLLFQPTVGRWNITVAENSQPFFVEWRANFGPLFSNIPVLFWLFFAGSVVLFKEMFKDLRKKESWILTGLYILFFFGLVFSRYSPSSSILNGSSFASLIFYYGSALLLAGFLVYCCLKYEKEGSGGFKKIDYGFMLLFSLAAFCLFTARSAMRLVMVLAPVTTIFLGYLIVKAIKKFREINGEIEKVIMGILVVLIILSSIFVFQGFYKSVISNAYNSVPSYYNQQWQKAMAWVRTETPESSVFAHWWDYGYWVQSIGNRATITDGGNAINWWNYLMGREVLTGDNEKDALEFLYSHNATHLLIDSSDIGKYTAFSSIGSDINYDRYSWIPVMLSDEKQIREAKDGEIRVYQGGSPLDEDLLYKKDEKDIFLPSQKAAVIGIILEYSAKEKETSFKQPTGVFYYQGQQIEIPLRYIYFNKKIVDFGTGIGAAVYILQRVNTGTEGLSVDNLGALMYLSPRLMRGMFAQEYLLNGYFNKFPDFQLAHSEPSPVIESLNSQGANLNEFIYYQDVQGPIKIWKINYTGEEKLNPEYLQRQKPSYITWEL